MKNFVRLTLVTVSIFMLWACGGSNPPISGNSGSPIAAPGPPNAASGSSLKHIYVLTASGVSIFPANAKGNVAPELVLSAATGCLISNPTGVAVDGKGIVYTANQEFIPHPSEPAIEAYAIDFKALNATQVAAIHGPHTDLGELHNIAADDAGDVYVANTGHITEYAAGANGDVSPLIDITDSVLSPGYGEARYPVAVAVGPDGSIYAVVQPTRIGPSGAIFVFPPGANGQYAPVSRSIVYNSLLETPLGIAVDKAGYIYVANQGSGITVYPPGTNDDPPPIRQITGEGAYGSGHDDVLGVAVDNAGRVYATTPSNQILVYAPNANGNAKPIAIIAGNRTGLAGAQQLVVH